MRIYFEYIKNAFKENLAYRMEYFMGIAQRILALVVQLYLWQALMGQSGEVSTNVGTITLDEMITYLFISTIISTVINRDIIYEINERVRSGQISTDLVKPLNFMSYMFARMIGGSLFNFLFQLLPVFIIGLLFIDIEYPSFQNLLFFAISVINAMVIMFFITFSLGLISFWYISMWQVDQLLGSAVQIFAGRIIPIWFFPQILVTITSFFPFRLIYFVPISIYLGKTEIADCWYAILQQVVWMVILYGVTTLVWRSAIRKLVIQGG